MSHNLTQLMVSIVITAILVLLWRARREYFAQIGDSWRYLLAGFSCLVSGEISNLIIRILLQQGRLSDVQTGPVIAAGHTLIVLGLLVTMLGVYRWLRAAQVLIVKSTTAIQRDGDLRKRITRDGMLLSTIPAALYRTFGSLEDDTSEIEFVNDKIADLLGYDASEFEADPLLFHSRMHDDDKKRLSKERSELWGRDNLVIEHRFRHKDGDYRWIRRHLKQVRKENGDRAEWHGCAFDITDLKKAERRLIDFLDAAPDALIAIREDGRVVMANTPAVALFGYTEAELLGLHVDVLLPGESSTDDNAHLLDYFAHQSAQQLAIGEDRFGKRKNGTQFPAEVSISPLGTEEVPVVICCVRDITSRKETEARLRQAQKMQSVGQLTGGIAHDFNNMLTIVVGNLQLLERESANTQALSHPITAAMDASMRAAELVKRLLAFSRQQLLAPKNTHINDLINEIEPLLCRTITENITLNTRLAPDLWPALIDPGQLENTLVNLAANARDAMESGGHLTIDTTNTILDDSYTEQNPDVVPGDYVLITVTDTGLGISEEDLPHVFEPFYSTKDVGKGSGMGLSMVYGFVKQSRGHIKIHSAESHGTSIKIYIPRSRSARDDSVEHTLRNKSVPGGDETVLLVEDDDGVRDIAIHLLTSLGYTVRQADCGKNALTMIDEHDDIDLIFTDIMMPGGMTGTELAQRALVRRSNLKVLYTSGYTDTTVFANNKLPKGSKILGKPYRKEELAQSLRSVLDQR